jgi:Lar family restriction alleviation protein
MNAVKPVFVDDQFEPSLAPCPFCGGKAAHYFVFGVRGRIAEGEIHGVICIECDVWVDCKGKTKDKAAAIWNRRA